MSNKCLHNPDIIYDVNRIFENFKEIIDLIEKIKYQLKKQFDNFGKYPIYSTLINKEIYSFIKSMVNIIDNDKYFKHIIIECNLKSEIENINNIILEYHIKTPKSQKNIDNNIKYDLENDIKNDIKYDKEINIKNVFKNNIENDLDEIKKIIEEKIIKTNIRILNKIKDKYIKKDRDFEIESYPEILIIIDSTNVINSYLNDIKDYFNEFTIKKFTFLPTKSLLLGFIEKSYLRLFNQKEYMAYINVNKLRTKIKEKIDFIKNKKENNDYLRFAILITQKKNIKRKSSKSLDSENNFSIFYNFNSETEIEISEEHPNGKTIKSLLNFFEEKNIYLYCIGY